MIYCNFTFGKISIKRRTVAWIVVWVELVEAIVKIMSFGYLEPYWSLKLFISLEEKRRNKK